MYLLLSFLIYLFIYVDNKISSIGCDALKDGLKHLHKLEILNLNCNKMGDIGLTYISESFSGLYSLKKLNIQSNEIGPGGIENLSLNLKYISTLISLKLDCIII